jgi:hypothetical protein
MPAELAGKALARNLSAPHLAAFASFALWTFPPVMLQKAKSMRLVVPDLS